MNFCVLNLQINIHVILRWLYAGNMAKSWELETPMAPLSKEVAAR